MFQMNGRCFCSVDIAPQMSKHTTQKDTYSGFLLLLCVFVCFKTCLNWDRNLQLFCYCPFHKFSRSGSVIFKHASGHRSDCGERYNVFVGGKCHKPCVFVMTSFFALKLPKPSTNEDALTAFKVKIGCFFLTLEEL